MRRRMLLDPVARRYERWSLTCELAHRRTPPIGANMTPITKKSGNTLFGLRTGLFQVRQGRFVLQWTSKILTARPSNVAVWTQCLDDNRNSVSLIRSGRLWRCRFSLAGLLLLGFLSPSASLLGSCSSKSTWFTFVRDIVFKYAPFESIGSRESCLCLLLEFMMEGKSSGLVSRVRSKYGVRST